MRIQPYSSIPKPLQVRPMQVRQADVTFAGDAKGEKKEKGFAGFWHTWVYNPKTFKRPFPIQMVMNFSTGLNRTVMLGKNGLTKIEKIDLPQADADRLRSVINKKNAVFLLPNHPEFLTDWMVDKEIAARFAPKMASWADWGLTNNFIAPVIRVGMNWFWRANNLVPNVHKQEGEELSAGQKYSMEWSSTGNVSLLHPEGTVPWTNDNITFLFDGGVEMPVRIAIAQAKEGKTPQKSYGVGLIYKYEFSGDVTKGLLTEIGKVAAKMKVSVNTKASMAEQFFELERNILAKAEAKFNLPETQRKASLTNTNFFDRQEQLYNFLLDDLVSRYGRPEGEGKGLVNRLEKAIKGAKGVEGKQKGQDLKKTSEMRRLLGMTREIYNKPTMSQENIYENLKRLREQMFPIAAGPRIVHIRVVEPIELSQYVNPDGSTTADVPQVIDPKDGKLKYDYSKLIANLKSRMQEKLDEVNKEIDPTVSRFQVTNAFYQAPAAPVAPPAEQKSPA